MIRIESVTRRFDRVLAVDNFNCEFSAGQTHVLIGPSGCGKTTVLRLVLGLETADEGRVFIDGELMSPISRPQLREKFGYLVQEGGLFPHLTARQNVALAAESRGLIPQVIEQKISDLLDLVHLDASVIAKYPIELSGGQRQRVSLMRALMLDPPILLFDEPFAALDPLVRDDLQQELKEIFSRLQKTVLLVTHDIREAAILADTITLLSNGKIVQQGTFEDLALRPAAPYVTTFIKAQNLPGHLAGFF